MEIFLLRHGDAESKASSDFERGLTKKGRNDIEKISDFLIYNNESIEMIISSPLKRAMQTAQIVQQKISTTSHVIEDERLSCGAHFSNVASIMKEYSKFSKILLVGHAPDMGGISSEMLGNRTFVNFKKGSLIKIAMHFIRPSSGFLIYYIYPELLKH